MALFPMLILLMQVRRKLLNLYFWLILFASIIILAKGAVSGYQNGFVKELEGLVSGICAIVVLMLISRLVTGTIGEDVSSRAIAIALVIVLGILYSLFRIIFGSLRLFAGLPVISFIDKVLGAGAGAAKAFMLLYVVDHLLRIWLAL